MNHDRRMIIGITGGIASGKSAVLRELSRRNIPTLSSDTLAHQCLKPGHPCYRKVVRHFGPSVLWRDKTINRQAVGKLVFANPGERKWLERLIHPWVIKRLRQFVKHRRGLAALDIPLLFEAHLQKMVNVIVVVNCSQKTQIARLVARNGFSKSDALRRIRSQKRLSEKCRRADFVLQNNGSISSLRKQIERLLSKKLLTSN